MTVGNMARPITDIDHWTFNEGSHYRLFEVMGAQVDATGVSFRVWAPNATRVSVIGDFNGWEPGAAPLTSHPSGIWTTRVEGARAGDRYKFHLVAGAVSFEKSDPYEFKSEGPPLNASIVWDLHYDWDDDEWMRTRKPRQALDAPVSIYEVHLGSWSRAGEVRYRDIAAPLIEHVQRCGFTHVEFMPLMEHPFYGSWGYQVTGYFAPTSRYGDPQDLMFLIDQLHRHGIGVILDWVPSHFPADPHALGRFDGTHLYEHADPRLGLHPDWDSSIFNYDRHEVRSFLLSSASFWLEKYHADGLRVDAVASMLYRDYSRRPGEWIPNEHGGRENLGAIAFLRRMNELVYADYDGVQTTAEESTAWPLVTRPTEVGGLGFGYKWDMGWMHDTLSYVSRDPIYRSHHHTQLTFRGLYAFSENFVLPLSHDEVVYGKGSLYRKQFGDRWQKLAGLRLLFGYQFAQPGKKLIFMGGEFAQEREWEHDGELQWGLLANDENKGVLRWVHDLNALYRSTPALHTLDCDAAGYQWVEPDDRDNSVLAFLRHGSTGSPVLVVANFTPVPRSDYRVGVPRRTRWRELLNSDAQEYGGSGIGNWGRVVADYVPWHGFEQSVGLSLPPLGILFLAPD